MQDISKETEMPQCVQTDVICCDFFKQNIREYGWFKLDNLGEEKYLMPHILGTKIRINYCPTCGKECRYTILSAELYHSI